MSAVNSIITIGAFGFLAWYLYNKFFPGQSFDQVIKSIFSNLPQLPQPGGLPSGPIGPSPVGNTPMAGNVIGAAGDWDKNAQTQKTVSNMQKHGVSFVIGLGDYAYSGSGSAWMNGVLAPYKGRFKGAIGNHDSDDYLGAFGQSKWTFMHPVNRGLAVVFVDTESGSTSKEIEQAMSQAKLAGYRNIAVALHKAVVDSSGAHHPPDEGKVMSALRPLLQKYGVRLVLQGHNHDFHHMVVGGVHYVTVGTGGRSLRGNPGGAPGERKLIDDTHGFLKITVGSQLMCQFISNDTGGPVYSFVV